jgi:hypothetical protein
VDEQLFVFLAFLRKAMFLGIHPDIFHVVGKIVFISYPMVQTKAIIRFEVASPMVGPPYVAALWS